MNVPPKPESDCGVTAMCVRPVPAAQHHTVPLWTVESLMFAALLVIAAVTYRLLLARHR